MGSKRGPRLVSSCIHSAGNINMILEINPIPSPTPSPIPSPQPTPPTTLAFFRHLIRKHRSGDVPRYRSISGGVFVCFMFAGWGCGRVRVWCVIICALSAALHVTATVYTHTQTSEGKFGDLPLDVASATIQLANDLYISEDLYCSSANVPIRPPQCVPCNYSGAFRGMFVVCVWHCDWF